LQKEREERGRWHTECVDVRTCVCVDVCVERHVRVCVWVPCLRVWYEDHPQVRGATVGCEEVRVRRQRFLLGLLGVLDDLLDDGGLLDEEGADDASPHAIRAPRSTICPLNRLARLGHVGVLARPERLDARQVLVAVAATDGTG